MIIDNFTVTRIRAEVGKVLMDASGYPAKEVYLAAGRKTTDFAEVADVVSKENEESISKSFGW